MYQIKPHCSATKKRKAQTGVEPTTTKLTGSHLSHFATKAIGSAPLDRILIDTIY